MLLSNNLTATVQRNILMMITLSTSLPLTATTLSVYNHTDGKFKNDQIEILAYPAGDPDHPIKVNGTRPDDASVIYWAEQMGRGGGQICFERVTATIHGPHKHTAEKSLKKYNHWHVAGKHWKTLKEGSKCGNINIYLKFNSKKGLYFK